MSTCIICDDTRSTFWGTENGFDAVQCDGCGLVYLDPWPDMSSRSEAVRLGQHKGEKVIRTTARRRDHAIAQYRRILGRVYPDGLRGSPLSWLDIGCGFGEFLEALQGVTPPDCTLVGVEPNDEKRSQGRKRGLRIDETLWTIQGTFDYASLLNVFSHLPDPISFLREVRSRIKGDGEILLQTGNGGDVGRSDVPGLLYFPDHLIFGSVRSITLALEKAGFSVVSIVGFPWPERSIRNVLKDCAQRIGRPGYNPVNWSGPFRDLWIRARPDS